MQYPFNLIHLKFFCDAVILCSVSEAAKKNFVTQSAISQGIAKLEKVIGVQLVTHSRSSFQLTEEGRIVFEQAGEVFKTLQTLQDKIQESKEEITGELHFTCTNSLGMSFIARAYKAMRERYPKVNLNFKLGGPNFIRSSLQQRSAEFALVLYDPDFSQFTRHVLMKGQFQLYQNQDPGPRDLESGILVDDKEGIYVESLRQYYEKLHGQALKIQAELAGWEVVARFVEKGIGLGFFPDYLMKDSRYPDLKIHPIKHPPFEYEICLIHKAGSHLSRAGYAFMEILKENS